MKQTMLSHLGCTLAAALLICTQPATAEVATARGTIVRALFLGDNGHHKPAERFKELQSALARRGIELNYTDQLADLNTNTLAKYDCLVLYANHKQISPNQEKELLEFVSNGKGFVPIHCASACFDNSSNFIALVGGKFKSHKTGTYRETIINHQHPVMDGLKEIESWDETYVHERLNSDIVVLAERREPGHNEPYTWVRMQGKGRVFYTAWGHNEKTWTHEGFHLLIENGIRWAADIPACPLTTKSGLKPFEYEPAHLPHYVPGGKRGTLGEWNVIQKPLAPSESARHIVTLPEFEARLFAADPQITKPIAMAWDERGRLWICESVDYPNEMQEPGKGHDRIKICEDTDGDGVADKFTVFAEGLSIPTSITFANGGVIVMQAPETLFLKSSKGDDHADIRQVLFTGWGTRDTHAGPSNIRWGFDNLIWGVVGYSGFDGNAGGELHKFTMGYYRFTPNGKKLEFIRSSNNNTWGFAWTEDGIAFGSTANNNAYMYMPIPNRFYEAVNGWSAARVETIADSQKFYPVTDKIRQVDVHGGYTAAAGAAIYTARNYPKEYWNKVAFVAEPTGHLVGKFRLESRGADFVAHNQHTFLASDDEWTAPIAAEVGPDGQLWVIDWYNYVVQHNPTPQGFATGKGNAYETPHRDHQHGRIYRVVWKGAKPVPPLRLDKDSPKELVAALQNDNLLWRMHAQRLLVERGRKDVVPALIDLVADQGADEINLNSGALHALWTLHGLGVRDVNTAALGALKHPAASVRRAALNVLPRKEASAKTILKGKLLEDEDAQVRMAALLALAEMPASEAVGTAVAAMLREERNVTDRWMAHAATAAAATHNIGFLQAILKNGASEKNPTVENGKAVRMVAGHYASRAPSNSVVSILLKLGDASPQISLPAVEGLAAGWPQGAAPTLAAGDGAKLVALLNTLPPIHRSHLVKLAGRWGRSDLFASEVAPIVKGLTSRVSDASLDSETRVEAAKQLIGLDDTSAVVTAILDQVNPLAPPGLAIGLLNAAGESRQNDAAVAIIAHWPKFTPVMRRAAGAVLLRKPAWAQSLLTAVEKNELANNDLGADHWQQLKSHSDKAVSDRAAKLDIIAVKASSTDMEALVEKLMPLASQPGDPVRGKAVFEATCQVCHSINGVGAKVGPDLTGFGSHPKSEILVAVVDPNRSVEANFRMWTASTLDGESLSGRLDGESQTSIDILDTTGQKRSIQRRDIVTLKASNLSLMPEGLGNLPSEDFKALLEFISESKPQKK